MTQEPEPDWSARLALSVAREVRRHRQAKGMSAQQLSDRCAAIGMPIQRSVLANLESGRRTTVTIAEIIILAAALEVPALALVFPAGYEKTFEGLPGKSGGTYEWAFWFTGEEALPYEESEDIEKELLAHPLNRARQIGRELIRHVDAFERYTERMARSLEEIRAFNRDSELYRHAVDELERLVEEREQQLDALKETDDMEVMARASERRRLLMQESQEVLGRMHALKDRLDKYQDDDREVELYRIEMERTKEQARKTLQRMKEDGWETPHIPESFADVFRSPDELAQQSGHERS